MHGFIFEGSSWCKLEIHIQKASGKIKVLLQRTVIGLLVLLNHSPAASTKSHASGKIKNRSFRILRMGSDVFFDADSELPELRRVKMQPCGVMG